MRKQIFIFLFFLLIANFVWASESTMKSVCGDDICQPQEHCVSDCGGREGITKIQCLNAGARWNDCGSPCLGTSQVMCMMKVCSPQCECSSNHLDCPEGYHCQIASHEIVGVCVADNNFK